MARRGQLDVELAEQSYMECWDQFQTWASQHTSKTLRFDHLFNPDDEDDEELDESLFRAGSQNHTVYETDRELRISYYDPIEIDLGDDLLEPTLGPSPTSPHWLNRYTTEPIPQYSSFSHIRQLNYIRGDVWTQKLTGERIRVASGDDEDEEGEDEDEGEGGAKEGGSKGKNKKEEREKEPKIEIKESVMDAGEARELLRKRTLVNLEVDDHSTTNPESMLFVPPEMKRRSMRETLFEYEESFIDIEAWQHLAVGWDNDEDIIGAETIRRLLYIHHMTEERIDRTKVIPQDIRKLYDFLRHRTYPDLDVIFPREPPLPRLHLDEWAQKDEQATLESRIREKAFNICSKIHCQVVMCPTHYAARERALTEQEAHETQEAQEADTVIRRGRGPQTPKWEVPKLSAHELFTKFKREKRQRCGNDCFYSLDVPEHGDLSFDITEHESDPSARTQADIETIWKVDPDAVPCDVAELSWDKVTCRQAYNIRNRLYSYFYEPEPDEGDPGIEERRGGHSGGSKEKYIPPPEVRLNSVYHRGDHDEYLYRWILPERWDPYEAMEAYRGKTQSIRQWTIPRRQRGRERCYLRQTTPVTFAFREPRFGEAEATKRNYLFDIPNYLKVSIDAGYAGNESRFANHPNNGKANCVAKYVWSGDEKHIALYATDHTWDGDELFLNYGKRYWPSEMPGVYEEESPDEQGSEEQSSEVEVLEEVEEVEEDEQGFSDESMDL
ncbi:unnamed protein product [Rhizoctonia solani]|nr:unnamed protein product [Rhizoctonia solani]